MLRVIVVAIVIVLLAFFIIPVLGADKKVKSNSNGDSNNGPDLPYSCTIVKAAIALKGIEYLKSTSLYKGFSSKQRTQAAQCLKS